MVNDAELCELGWEVMVVLLVFLQIWMVPRECKGICGVTMMIGAQ